MNIDLRQARHLVALSRLGNFSRAAEALRISQPALSRSVANFEALCGARLFDRTPQGVVVSAFGRPIILQMEALLNQAERIGREIGERSEGRAGAVSLGIGPMATSLVPALLTKLIQADPRVEIRVEIASADKLVAALLSDRLEFCLFAQDLAPLSGEVSVRSIGAVDLSFLVRRGHPLLARETVALADLEGWPIASGSPPEEPRTISYRDQAMPPFTVICDNFFALEQTVAESDAILVSSRRLLSSRYADQLVHLPVQGWPATEENLCLVSRTGRSASPLALRAIDILQGRLMN